MAGAHVPKRTGKRAVQPTVTDIAEQREKDRKVLELLIAGATLDQAAVTAGYADKSGAWRAMRRCLDRQESTSVREYRDLENARYDRLQTVLWPRALNGDLKVIDRLLRLFERRAKLNGLDQPQQFVGAFSAESIPRDPAERAAVLVSLRDRLAERMAEHAAAETGE